jgi:GNAT superfamily N-acetyltransferase
MSIEMNVEIKKGMFLRTLRPEDRAALAVYFEALGVETRRRFQPHPLTREAAAALCDEAEPSAIRLVIERRGGVIGYFILERGLPVYETPRYREFGVDLAAGSDLLFAPSVADAWQNRGIASLAMPHLIAFARQLGARSLVLMGGTQATNHRAIAFYEKFGFKRFGGYQTDVFNHDMRLWLEA